MMVCKWRTVLLGICLSVWIMPVYGAPQTFNTALPVAQGSVVFRQQIFYRKASKDTAPANRHMEVSGAVSVLGYGITGKWALFGTLPLFDKKLKMTLPGGLRVTRDIHGLGDVRLFSRYTLYSFDAPGRTFRIAPFAGIELPSGNNNDKDAIGKLPVTFQLGSGSWDPFMGIVATLQTLEFQIGLQARYQRNTKADGFKFGDQTRLDGALQYRLWPREFGRGAPGFLYGVLEGNFVYSAKNRLGGGTLANSGGISLFVAPGLQYITRRWIIEAIVQIPIFQNLNGLGLKDNYTGRAGFRFNF